RVVVVVIARTSRFGRVRELVAVVPAVEVRDLADRLAARLAELLVAVSEEDRALHEDVARDAEELLDLVAPQEEEGGEQRRHTECLRGQHHVLAGLEQADAAAAGDLAELSQRSVGPAAVL